MNRFPAKPSMPAFSTTAEGLTRREYIATHIMCGLGVWTPNFAKPTSVSMYSPEWEALAHVARAEYAVASADALLEALSK